MKRIEACPGIARLVRGVAYPATMILAFGAFAGLTTAGLPDELAAMLTVALCGLSVTLHELKQPYRRSWRPRRRDVSTDALFMLLVQVLLPELLGFAAAAGAAMLTARDAWRVAGLWPHHWPAPAQAVLLLAVADFLRYWLHRAAHTSRLLWRFHAVHHSPERLYWFNVGRFHPIDKGLQFLLDTAPFVLLGVGGEVISLYFVFYAVNGFYQHANCDVRLGPLNYLVSGPELHRWHHSRRIAESNNNYGNNLIVWDLLFGTYYRPAGRAVGRLGLLERGYPTSFPRLLRRPFSGAVHEET